MKYEILVGVDHICQLVPVETFPPGAQSSDWSGCNFTIHNIGLSGQTLYMYMDWSAIWSQQLRDFRDFRIRCSVVLV